MSHISVMKTAFTDRDILLEALKDIGLEIREEEGLEITDGINTCPVDFCVDLPGSAPIGFRQSKKGWQMTADWFKVLTDRKKFQNKVAQQYALISVRRTLAEQGFTLAEEKRDEKDRIHIVLRRFA